MCVCVVCVFDCACSCLFDPTFVCGFVCCGIIECFVVSVLVSLCAYLCVCVGVGCVRVCGCVRVSVIVVCVWLFEYVFGVLLVCVFVNAILQ